MMAPDRKIPTPGVWDGPGTDQPSPTPSPEHHNYDYIVVGAGSAGCVIANRLTENKYIRVLLLEAGPVDEKPAIHVPGMFATLWGTEVDWKYHTVNEPHLLHNRQSPETGRQVLWPRGKVLGGSSSISSMVYIRGNRRDYDTWEYLGNEGWSYNDVLPYFMKAENQERGKNEFHNVDGPMTVSDIHPPNPSTRAFVEAAVALGYASNKDFNALEQDGAGIYQVTIKYSKAADGSYTGERVSSADAYLRPLLARHPDNFTLETNTLVKGLLFEGKRAVGVEYSAADGTLKQARAGNEVILCAGSVNSPWLLMFSGIGPASVLKDRGIPVVHNLPGVGQNLQDHTIISVGYKYGPGKQSDPAAAGAAEGGLFLRTRHGLDTSAPNLQFHFSHWLLIDRSYLTPPLDPTTGFAFVSTLVKPQSRGAITLAKNPADPPDIQANYLEAEVDMDVLLTGVTLSRKLARQTAFDEFRGDEVAPGPDVQTVEDLRTYIRLACAALFHPVGTCKMGHDRMAVVNPQLQVHGIDRLRIVDASIMPIITTGNTHAPTVMIAEKAADMIKQGR